MSSVQRRLCAIMFSDIHGYSRMMGRDEEATLRLLDELTRLMKPAIEEHRGSVLKYIGDAVLAVFDSAADAVECAVSIQRRLGERNAGRPNTDRVYIRIGIHIGDIVLKDNDVFGDGVNIAARIEPTARPGGICVSDAVFGLVREVPDLRSENLGPHSLKNIREPVTIHRIVTGAEKEEDFPMLSRLQRLRAPSRRAAMAFAVAFAVAAAGALVWRRAEHRMREKYRPFTFAVAPFYATPDQAKDAALIQQDLIRQILNKGLGHEPGVRIIADNIAKAPRSYAEAKRLGLQPQIDADVVIWGDVLLLDDEISISPHLTFVRPERYGRDSDPSALHARLDRAQQLDLQAAKANELGNVAFLIAAEYFRQKGQSDEALSLLERIQPPTEDGLYLEGRIYYGERRWPEMDRALAQASKLAPDDPRPNKLMGHALFARGDLAGSARQFQLLLKRSPRDVDLLQALGLVDAERGRLADAEKEFRRALELDPKHALSYVDLGDLYYKKRQFNQAADVYATLIHAQPDYLFAHLLYYICLRKAGQDKAALDHMKRFLKTLPANKGAGDWPEALVYFFAGKLSESGLLELIGQGEADARLRRECEGYYYLAMSRLFDSKDPDREKVARAYLAKSLATGLGNYYEYDLARFEMAALDSQRPSP